MRNDQPFVSNGDGTETSSKVTTNGNTVHVTKDTGTNGADHRTDVVNSDGEHVNWHLQESSQRYGMYDAAKVIVPVAQAVNAQNQKSS